MTTNERPRPSSKIIGFPALALACLCTSGCVSQSETEFAQQHGFKRSDYFGTGQNMDYVPVDAEKPIRPTGREIRLGRPVF